MVKKSAASGNAPRKPRSRKAAASAANAAGSEQQQEAIARSAAQGAGWGLGAAMSQGEPEPEQGVGLDGQAASTETTAAEEVVTRGRRGRSPAAGDTPANDASEGGAVNFSNMKTDLVAGVEKIERLQEEIDALKEDTKEFFGDLKSKGYSTKIVRKVLARRRMDPDKRAEDDSLLDLYEQALREEAERGSTGDDDDDNE